MASALNSGYHLAYLIGAGLVVVAIVRRAGRAALAGAGPPPPRQPSPTGAGCPEPA